jgi:hypothetical protein
VTKVIKVINEDKDKKPKSEKVIVHGREVIVSSKKVLTFDTTELRTVPRGEIQLYPREPKIKPPPEHQDIPDAELAEDKICQNRGK